MSVLAASAAHTMPSGRREQVALGHIRNQRGNADEDEDGGGPRHVASGIARLRVVQAAVEPGEQPAHPRHRVPDCAHQAIRVPDKGLDQQRKKGQRDAKAPT